MQESINEIRMLRTVKVNIVPVNLDIEAQIRAFWGEKSILSLSIFFVSRTIRKLMENEQRLFHSVCSFHITHQHADPHYPYSKFISRRIIAYLPFSGNYAGCRGYTHPLGCSLHLSCLPRLRGQLCRLVRPLLGAFVILAL